MKKNIIFGIIVALLLGFIWGNSLIPKTQSYAISNDILELIKNVFHMDGISRFMVRKTAHVIEYSLLGIVFFYAFNKYSTIKKWVLILSAGAVIALIDEYIQRISNRNSQFTDVILDLVAVLIGALIIELIKKVKQKKQVV